MILWLTLAALAVILLIDLPRLLKRRNRREIIIFSLIAALALLYAALLFSGLDFKSPIDQLHQLYSDIGLNYETIREKMDK